MATITNLCDHTLSIVGVIDGGMYRHELAPHRIPTDGTAPGKPPSIEIPDEHARDWAGRSQWVGLGKVRIDYDSVEIENSVFEFSKTKPASKQHWRKAVNEARACDDLDVLEDMLAAEDRPAVREAIEARMAEVRG